MAVVQQLRAAVRYSRCPTIRSIDVANTRATASAPKRVLGLAPSTHFDEGVENVFEMSTLALIVMF